MDIGNFINVAGSRIFCVINDQLCLTRLHAAALHLANPLVDNPARDLNFETLYKSCFDLCLKGHGKALITWIERWLAHAAHTLQHARYVEFALRLNDLTSALDATFCAQHVEGGRGWLLRMARAVRAVHAADTATRSERLQRGFRAWYFAWGRSGAWANPQSAARKRDRDAFDAEF